MSRFVVMADWDTNAPHLSAKARTDLWASIPDYQKDARGKGIPQLGAGVIYPIADSEILCDAFPIPDHYVRGYGLDVGWNRTAAIWDAMDPETGTVYRYDEHYGSEASPTIHGAAIRRRGSWIPGKIDPASRGRSQEDGKKLLDQYRKAIYGEEDLGEGQRLLTIANNAVETGIREELMALTEGRLKIFRNRCPNWLAERRLYRRDEHGRVVKKHDHALDAGRYRTMSGSAWLAAKPLLRDLKDDPLADFMSGSRHNESGLGWMRNIS